MLIYNLLMFVVRHHESHFSVVFSVIVLVLFSIFAFSCSRHNSGDVSNMNRSAKDTDALGEPKSQIDESHLVAIREYVSALPLEEQVNQLFIVNIDGGGDENSIDVGKNLIDVFSPVEYRGDVPLIPGAYIFFYFNLADEPEKIISFTNSVADFCLARNCIMPFLSLDQEGGVVARLRKVSATLPSAEKVAQTLSLENAYELYDMQARQMRALGFTMNFAPVAEPLTDDNKDFLESRSYGTIRDAEDYASSALIAFQENGIASVLKHFPGNTNTDPHSGLPNITLTKDEFQKQIIEPFSAVCEYKPAAVLMSHALTQNVDASMPACLSSIWIGDVLRGQMQFDGLVVSDDIFMDALMQNGFPPEVAVIKAVEAGIDMIMSTEKFYINSADIIIERARADKKFAERVFESCVRVLCAKEKFGLIALVQDAQNNSASDVYKSFSVVTASPPALSTEEMLLEFTKAKDENIVFNNTYFSNTQFSENKNASR